MLNIHPLLQMDFAFILEDTTPMNENIILNGVDGMGVIVLR